MMRTALLTDNEIWIGFDEHGISVAASIERRRPSLREGSVMHGCADVKKCKRVKGDTVFGRHVSDFEVLE